MLLLLTDTAWGSALRTAGIVLGCWVAVSIPAALLTARILRAGKGRDGDQG